MQGASVPLLMLGTAISVAALNVVIRLASGEMHLYQMVFLRNVFALLWMAPWLLGHGVEALKTKRFGFFSFRSGLSLIGMYATFYAIGNMALADATALTFTIPIFVGVGAVLFLGEKIQRARVIATICGFIGVLVILRPGVGVVEPAALVALLGSVGMAGSGLAVRSLSKTENTNAIIVYLLLFTVPLSLPLALWVWIWPSWHDLGLMVLLGGLGALSHATTTRAFALAEASAVMPYDYLRLPAVACAGYLFFNEIPDVWTLVGAAVIALSTIWFARLEARRKREEGLNAKR